MVFILSLSDSELSMCICVKASWMIYTLKLFSSSVNIIMNFVCFLCIWLEAKLKIIHLYKVEIVSRRVRFKCIQFMLYYWCGAWLLNSICIWVWGTALILSIMCFECFLFVLGFQSYSYCVMKYIAISSVLLVYLFHPIVHLPCFPGGTVGVYAFKVK